MRSEVDRPTNRRSIVTSLVWGILAMCVIGSPGDASGQTDGPSVSPISEVGSWVPVRDVEELDTSTRLMWTLQMIFAPGALAHVSPLYAYDPRELEGRTVYPDRIGRVATVITCDETMKPRLLPTGELSGTNVRSPETGSRSPLDDSLSVTGADDINKSPWCANYGSDTADTFHATLELLSEELLSDKPDGDGQQPSVYFATTYPLPDIEPKKRFVVGR